MSDIAIPNQNDNTPAAVGNTLMAKGVAVSYTHLTLPTICSV